MTLKDLGFKFLSGNKDWDCIIFWNLIGQKFLKDIIQVFREQSQVKYFKGTKYIEQSLVEKYKDERPHDCSLLYPLLNILSNEK